MLTPPPNITIAKQGYTLGGEYFSGRFDLYSPSYLTTNENLRYLTYNQPFPKESKILTTCGSGDQPLFYARWHNPEFIDTFDISYCSYTIMEIKTIAIKHLEYRQYKKLLYDLYCTNDIMKVALMRNILPYMTPDTQKFINKMSKYQIIRKSVIFSYTLNEREYIDIQQKINKPFNFIWDDIKNLNKHLNKKYDIINLSNILMYKYSTQTLIILDDMYQRLNCGGEIVLWQAPICATEFAKTHNMEIRDLKSAMFTILKRVY